MLRFLNSTLRISAANIQSPRARVEARPLESWEESCARPDLSGFWSRFVGFHFGFLDLPDMEWPSLVKSLGCNRRVCRVFIEVESSRENHN
jgi:hypothetical protein